ncbi:MAG: NAD(P)-dependent oxidoreductase [Fimbriimonadaceae bacterium]
MIHLTEAEPLIRAHFEDAFDAHTLSIDQGTLNVDRISSPSEIEILCVTVRSSVDKAVIDALPNLKMVATGSAGFDHIDIDHCREKGIVVSNVPEYGPAVAEYNIALMIALSRKVHLAYVQTLQRDFSPEGLLGRNLQGRTLGIIGTGIIGSRVAQMAAAFEMKVIAVDPNPNQSTQAAYVTMPELLAQSDIFALCCPLTPETKHLLGKAEFEQMKRGVLIVNTSRGAVIDTQALVRALNEGIVDGAALDVLEGETLLSSSTLNTTLANNPTAEQTQTIAEDLTLMRHPKVIITPHIAYYTADSLEQIRVRTVGNVQAFLAGRPQNVVSSRK